MNTAMEHPHLLKTLCLLALACVVSQATAQEGASPGELTPTLRALLMLERPATVTEEQWTRVIEQPANRLDLPITIYEEETIDLRELQKAQWYIMLPGRRPPEKQPQVAAGCAER